MYMHNEEHHKLFQLTPNKSLCTLVVSSSGKAQLKQSRSGVARHQCDTDAPAVLYMKDIFHFSSSVRTEV